MIDWHRFVEWFLMGFFGGLGYLTVSFLWSLIIKR